MLEVLAEVVGAEELLRLVTLSKLVYMVEVFGAVLPARRISKLLTAVATNVSAVAGHGRVECCFWAGERSARPRMTSQMEGVLVAFCFVLVFEAVGAISTTVLFFGLVQPEVILGVEFLGLFGATFTNVHALEL